MINRKLFNISSTSGCERQWLNKHDYEICVKDSNYNWAATNNFLLRTLIWWPGFSLSSLNSCIEKKIALMNRRDGTSLSQPGFFRSNFENVNQLICMTLLTFGNPLWTR